jgi:hypothetical protein
MNCCTFAGTWQGTVVAVKTMLFPAAMSGKEKREKMAIMETAISSTLSHPNIVQTYTYVVKPLTGELAMQVRVGRSQGPGKALGSAAREGGGGEQCWNIDRHQEIICPFCYCRVRCGAVTRRTAL